MTEYYNPGSEFSVGSPFGRRIHPITKKASGHGGQDYPAPAKTLIKAAGKGKVVVNKYNYNTVSKTGYGNYVVLEHQDTKTNSIIHTLYAHMVELSSLKIGDIVEKGGTVGKVGTTGGSTGNHLHFEVRTGNNKGAPFSNTPVDPVSYDISGLTEPGGTAAATSGTNTTNNTASNSTLSAFQFPIRKQDGSSYTADELYGFLGRETSGHYLLGSHQFWHGGIHFTDQTASQCVLHQPVRCIADGEVIAYRINKTYPESTLERTKYQYSTSFCLVKHEYKSPPAPIVNPVAPEKPSKKEDWAGKTVTLNANRNVRDVATTDNTKCTFQGLLKKGSKIKIIEVQEKTVGNYFFAKAKIVSMPEATLNNVKKVQPLTKAAGDEVYIAAFNSKGNLEKSGGSDIFANTPVTDWTGRSITLKEDYTGYKAVADKSVKILLPAKTQLQVIEVQKEAVDGFHYSKVKTNTVLKALDSAGQLSDIPANQEIWAAITDADGNTLTNESQEIYTDTTPPAEPKTNTLTFYSLYMHLLPYEEYPVKQNEAKNQVKITADQLRVRDKIIDDKDAKVIGKIEKGTTVTVLESKEDAAGKYLCVRGTIADNSGEILDGKNEVTPAESGFWFVHKEKSGTTWKIYAEAIPQPKREYPSFWAKGKITATVKVKTLKTREAPAAGTDVAGKELGANLTTGDQVEFNNSQVKSLKIDGKAYRMAPCTLKNRQLIINEQPVTTFWTSVESSFVDVTKAEPDTGSFDKIETAHNPKISAGDPVGYLGLYETPASIMGGKFTKKQVHIEIFTAESEENINKFLNNEAGLKGGKEHIHIPRGTVLYKATPKAGTKNTEIQHTTDLLNTYYMLKEDHIIAPDKIKITDGSDPMVAKGFYQVILYENRQSVAGYISETKTAKISQYEWAKLGFKIIEEENSNSDGFVDEINMTPFFQELCQEIDKKENGGDGDGKLSLPELRSALKDPVLSDKWSKLIAKHPTEWQAKGNADKWKRLEAEILKGELNKPLLKHEQERINKLVFWDDVEGLKGKNEVYHFHPVAFINNMPSNENKRTAAQIIFPLKVKPHNDKDGKWKQRYWAVPKVGNPGASMAIMDWGRKTKTGEKRLHAARDLYTDPFAEVVAICDGKVLDVVDFYCGTHQISIHHKTKDGREFIIRYGELDPKSIVVKIGDSVIQNQTIGKTGKLIEGGKPLMLIGKEVVFMLHFEYFTGSEGLNIIKPLSNNTRPYWRRKDLVDPLAILQEGYRGTFEAGDVTGSGWAHSAFAKLIGKVESNNKYTVYNHRAYNSKLKTYYYKAENEPWLVTLTLEELKDKQAAGSVFAAGRFQVITNTFAAAVTNLNLDLSTKFDQATQDKIFEQYLIKTKRKAVINYLEGSGKVEDAAYALALEFASIGVAKGRRISDKITIDEHGKKKIEERYAKGGESYYAGDGYNKAHVTPEEMINALKESKNVAK